MGILLLIALAQDLEGILRELRDERAEVRDRASAALTEGWERWSDPDLARLEEVRKGSDLEPAGRAADALATIRLRRSLGKDLLGRFPDLERVVRSGTAEERREILLKLRRSWRLADVNSDPLRALADAVVTNGFELEEKDELLADLIPPYRSLLRPWLRRPELRWQAIDRIADLEAREYAPELKRLLADPDPRVRFGAADTLADWGILDGKNVIIEQLGGQDPVLVRRAVVTLGMVGAREQVPRLMKLLENEDRWELRSAATWALAALGAVEAEAPIAALLEDESWDTRAAAARALATLGAKRRAPEILARLPKATGQESWVMKYALFNLGLEPLRPRLEALLVDPDGRTRAQAWDLMAHLDPAHPLRFLDHENADAREYAVWALVDLNRPEDADRFAALLSDPEPDIRRAALDGLAGTAGPRHVDAVVARLVDREGLVRSAAVDTLMRLQARDRADDVAERLKDVDEWTVSEAIEALGLLGARKHADRLKELLASDRWAKEAAGALGEMGARADYAALLRHEDLDVRSRAVRILDALDLGTVKDLAPLLDERDGQGEAEQALRALAWIGNDEALRLVRSYGTKDPLQAAYALLEHGGPGELPRALEALADVDVHHHRFACEALARWTARGLTAPDPAKLAVMLDRADETADQSGKAAALAVRVGLGLREPKSLLPGDVDRLPQEVGDRVLLRAFAPEATAKLHRPFVPGKDIDSPSAMSAALEKAWGVKVEVDPAYYFPGIHPAGARTTGMRLIERLLRRHRLRISYLPSTGLIADGDVIRVVLESEAKGFWRKRLEATK